jgi:hypothetical protein
MPVQNTRNRKQQGERPENSGQRIIEAFITEYLAGVKHEYKYLKPSIFRKPPMSLDQFRTEILLYGLHCLDRVVFDYRGPEYREQFMLGAYSWARGELASSRPPEHRSALLQRIDDLYNTRQKEYGAWRLPDGVDLQGTLCWQFGRRMCEDAQVYNPAVVMTLSYTARGIYETMVALVEHTAV